MKTLKEILQLEVNEPKSPDEKRFKDKHVVVNHKDANGNDDDLFKAKNIKTVDRELRHGYNPGEDEKVYEEVEELDERVTRKLSSKEQGKIAKVMREFSKGSLKDSHGKTVTDKKQALAIAYSQMNEEKSMKGASPKELRVASQAAQELGDTESLRMFRQEYKERMDATVRRRAAAKASTTPKELSTQAIMARKLGVDLNNPIPPSNYTNTFGPDQLQKPTSNTTHALVQTQGKVVITPIENIQPRSKRSKK